MPQPHTCVRRDAIVSVLFIIIQSQRWRRFENMTRRRPPAFSKNKLHDFSIPYATNTSFICALFHSDRMRCDGNGMNIAHSYITCWRKAKHSRSSCIHRNDFSYIVGGLFVKLVNPSSINWLCVAAICKYGLFLRHQLIQLLSRIFCNCVTFLLPVKGQTNGLSLEYLDMAICIYCNYKPIAVCATIIL